MEHIKNSKYYTIYLLQNYRYILIKICFRIPVHKCISVIFISLNIYSRYSDKEIPARLQFSSCTFFPGETTFEMPSIIMLIAKYKICSNCMYVIISVILFSGGMSSGSPYRISHSSSYRYLCCIMLYNIHDHHDP